MELLIADGGLQDGLADWLNVWRFLRYLIKCVVSVVDDGTLVVEDGECSDQELRVTLCNSAEESFVVSQRAVMERKAAFHCRQLSDRQMITTIRMHATVLPAVQQAVGGKARRETEFARWSA